jgi:hypothetical protein
MFGVQILQMWLQVHGTTLAAAGYPLESLAKQLQQLQDALTAVTSASSLSSLSSLIGLNSLASSSSSKSADEALTAALQQAGSALCCMAVPCLCNNPGCTNISGPTELSLVPKGSGRCAGCRVAHYCCRACQTEHWKQHKPVCSALAAAAAAAAAAGDTVVEAD